MKLDPSMRGMLPDVEPAVPFTAADGRTRGWRIKLPRSQPLATPAIADGRVFLGGGCGSYEFYALDAETGQVIWQHQTDDDGPTAAVVEDEYVVFNTESCELEVLTVAGEPVWKHWLGDPLMSMPAVAGGRVFMAYPDSLGDQQHYLACFDPASGTARWKQPISGEIITAPVLADGAVYLATLDGTLYCFDQTDGTLYWHDAVRATSSPTVRNGKCYYSQREEVPSADGSPKTEQTEYCAWREVAAGSPTRPYSSTRRKADYLDHAKRAARSPVYAHAAQADAAVGFAFSKGDAKIHQAMKHLGTAQVYGIWSFQGSKPFISGPHLFASLGDAVCALNVETEELVWKTCLRKAEPESELLDFLSYGSPL